MRGKEGGKERIVPTFDHVFEACARSKKLYFLACYTLLGRVCC